MVSLIKTLRYRKIANTMSPPNRKVHVFIVSDATGMTAEMVISAVLVQFKEIKPAFKRFPYIKTMEQIKTILEKAEAVQGIVIYSLVLQELRTWIRREARKMNIYTIDLLGPFLERIGKPWNLIPTLRPGLLRGIGEESFRLAESIDFTLKHDDGQGVETLENADLIIIGVSRTSKIPTSLYLSCNNNLKVANVPIIMDIKPSNKVFTLKTQKVGFTISPERLAFIRQKRLQYASSSDYTDMSQIKKELKYSHRIFNQIKGLNVIDVTNSSMKGLLIIFLSNIAMQWRLALVIFQMWPLLCLKETRRFLQLIFCLSITPDLRSRGRYHAAESFFIQKIDLIYSLRPPLELIPYVIRLARILSTDLIVKPLSSEHPGGQLIRHGNTVFFIWNYL